MIMYFIFFCCLTILFLNKQYKLNNFILCMISCLSQTIFFQAYQVEYLWDEIIYWTNMLYISSHQQINIKNVNMQICELKSNLLHSSEIASFSTLIQHSIPWSMNLFLINGCELWIISLVVPLLRFFSFFSNLHQFYLVTSQL